jgi:AcrR family transcriptional regulator
MTARARGRPVGDSGAREAILDAARRQFSDRGYRRTTLRTVADRAGVDPRLVLHYFGSKAGLFQASVVLPVDPEQIAADVFVRGSEGIGRRAAERLVGVLEDDATRQGLIALLRAAVAEPEAADQIRAILGARVIGPMASHIELDHPDRRAAMLGTMLVGLAVGRHIVALEPLASMTADELVETLAPVIGHYLADEAI